MSEIDRGYTFESLCVPLQGELINYARRLTGGDASRAADVVQEALLKALIAWPRWEPDGDPSRAARGWLYRIVCNTFTKDYHRVKVRNEALHDHRERLAEAMYGDVSCEHVPPNYAACYHDSSPDSTRQSTDGPYDVYVTAQRFCGDYNTSPHWEVLEAIEQIDPIYGEVVKRHYLWEHEYSRIAEDLCIPRGTVTSRLHRGRRALRPLLEDYAREEYGLRTAADVHPLVQAIEYVETNPGDVDGVVGDDDGGALDVAEAAPDLLAAG